MGFKSPVKPRIRTAWLNYKGHNLNAQKRTSVHKLKQMKAMKLANGEIDIGNLVVPIEYETMHIREDGTMVSNR